MIICARTLNIGRRLTERDDSAFRTAMVRERFRLSRRAFDRGLVGGWRPLREGGPRPLLPLVFAASASPRVVSERRTYRAFVDSTPGADRDASFTAWERAQRLTSATAPCVRGTRSLGGGLVPLRYVRP